jgi:hypothetical protein
MAGFDFLISFDCFQTDPVPIRIRSRWTNPVRPAVLTPINLASRAISLRYVRCCMCLGRAGNGSMRLAEPCKRILNFWARLVARPQADSRCDWYCRPWQLRHRKRPPPNSTLQALPHRGQANHRRRPPNRVPVSRNVSSGLVLHQIHRSQIAATSLCCRSHE